MAVATAKAEEKKERRRWRLGLKERLRSSRKPRRNPFPRQHDATDGHDAPGSKPKVAGGVATAVNTVHSIYKFAICQNSQITLKFS